MAGSILSVVEELGSTEVTRGWRFLKQKKKQKKELIPFPTAQSYNLTKVD